MAAALLGACATSAPGPTVDPKLADVYLACDKESTVSMLDPSTAAICSEVYEKLLASMPGETQKDKFATFMTWWKANKRY